jgi:hypothetical protein
MRKLLITGGAAALIAMPAVALAQTDEPVVETDPAAEAIGGPTTDKALHSEGTGGFRYEGSGGVTITVNGIVAVRDLSGGKGVAATASGFGKTKSSKDGVWTRYAGAGSLTLDGSGFRVRVRGQFTADVDPTAANRAVGTAWDWGSGASTLKGGVAHPFWRSQRILLTSGPMAVDLFGRGGPRWHRDGSKGGKNMTVRRVVVTRTFVNGQEVSSRRVVTQRRWWTWNHREPGATWRLNGPAAGAVDIATITGRLRVWDRSTPKDLAVTVPAGTATQTLADGSVVYDGLRDAKVALTGTGFRMKAVAWDVEGTFTPLAGSLARGYVRGKGTFDTADQQDLRARVHGGTRVLLQPVAAK